MGAQLRLRVTGYAPQCAHIWAQDRGSPHETVQRAKWVGLFFNTREGTKHRHLPSSKLKTSKYNKAKKKKKTVFALKWIF